MLHMGKESETDESCKKSPYQPISGMNLRNANPTGVRVEYCDYFFHPCDSYIELSGRIVKLAG